MKASLNLCMRVNLVYVSLWEVHPAKQSVWLWENRFADAYFTRRSPQNVSAYISVNSTKAEKKFEFFVELMEKE